jgi:hypothetical protein
MGVFRFELKQYKTSIIIWALSLSLAIMFLLPMFSGMLTEERGQNENILSGALKSIFAISEGYPELKANENYMDLQNNLRSLEDEISQSRKYYNGVVKVMNNKVEILPFEVYSYTKLSSL